MKEKLLFTRDNIVIDRDIYYEDDYICAYIQVWFDAEAKFNIKLEDDEYVNVYALYYPDKDVFEVRYRIYGYTGADDREYLYKDITKEEEELILQMMDEISIKETGMTILEHWKQIQNEEAI